MIIRNMINHKEIKHRHNKKLGQIGYSFEMDFMTKQSINFQILYISMSGNTNIEYIFYHYLVSTTLRT